MSVFLGTRLETLKRDTYREWRCVEGGDVDENKRDEKLKKTEEQDTGSLTGLSCSTPLVSLVE